MRTYKCDCCGRKLENFQSSVNIPAILKEEKTKTEKLSYINMDLCEDCLRKHIFVYGSESADGKKSYYFKEKQDPKASNLILMPFRVGQTGYVIMRENHKNKVEPIQIQTITIEITHFGTQTKINGNVPSENIFRTKEDALNAIK